jgi:hypothetical protein
MPDEVGQRAIAAYLHAAARLLPEVTAPGFARDVEAAAVGWTFLTTTWFLDNALDRDPLLNPSRPTPTRRATARPATHRPTATPRRRWPPPARSWTASSA